MKRKQFLDGRIRTDCSFEFRKAFPSEGLVGRKTEEGGYYFLYENRKPTSDLIFLKRIYMEYGPSSVAMLLI